MCSLNLNWHYYNHLTNPALRNPDIYHGTFIKKREEKWHYKHPNTMEFLFSAPGIIFTTSQFQPQSYFPHLRYCKMFSPFAYWSTWTLITLALTQDGRYEFACAPLCLCEPYSPICVTLKWSSPLNTMTHCDEQSCIDAQSLPQSCVRLLS